MAKKPQQQKKLSVEELQAIDWNSLLQKYGSLVLMFLKMFLGVVDDKQPKLKAGARASEDQRCPHEHMDACCQEALASACQTVALILACDQCCAPEDEDAYG